jgi:hypothetical protein
MASEDTTRQKDGKRSRFSRLFKGDKTSAPKKQDSIALSSQNRNQTSAFLPTSARLSSVSTPESTPVPLPSTHSTLNQGVTLDASHSSGLPLLPNDGSAQLVPPDVSDLSINQSTINTSHIPTTSPTSPDTSNRLGDLHLTSNNSNSSASTEPAPGISTIQVSGKTLWDQAADSLCPKEKAFV